MQEQIPALVRELRTHKDPQRATRLLLEELTHRVDGEFAAAMRMVSLATALAQTRETQSILTAIQRRFENFARVHRTLRIPEARATVDGRAYLRELCEAICLSRLSYRGFSLELPEKAFEIDSEQCWRLGMIVSELMSNAAKHSFVSHPAQIVVMAARRGALISCQVADNGVPAENELEERGMRLARALATELHGEIEICYRGGAHVATVVFPAVCRSDAVPVATYPR